MMPIKVVIADDHALLEMGSDESFRSRKTSLSLVRQPTVMM